MSTLYVVLYPRQFVDKGVKKTQFRTVGQAFPSKSEGGGFDLNLTEIPPPEIRTRTTSDGEVVIESHWRLLIREKRDREERPGQRPAGPKVDRSGFDPDDGAF